MHRVDFEARYAASTAFRLGAEGIARCIFARDRRVRILVVRPLRRALDVQFGESENPRIGEFAAVVMVGGRCHARGVL